ncbi:MAG: peptide chain release factor N(5)-glutamine methyltransferase [Fidelibacterota bacterium]
MEQKQPKIWRVIDLINWGESYFRSKNIQNARREIEWLLCDVLSCQRINLYLEFEKPVMGMELQKFKSFINRRIKGEPFQHIIGKAPFYGRDFEVGPQVLIPRPETEIIIDILKSRTCFRSALEVGTGSGCIAITVIKENIAEQVIATDISKSALKIARQNAAKFSAENISFRRHDFLKDSIQTKFDLVVSNPPYIGLNEMEKLDPVVSNYDPPESLTDNGDGLAFFRRFAERGQDLLLPGGVMVLEFGGQHQQKPIEDLFGQYNFQINFHKDLQGDPRVVEIAYMGE